MRQRSSSGIPGEPRGQKRGIALRPSQQVQQNGTVTGKLVQQKDESMGTAFFHTTSNLLTLLSLSPPFDKEGGEMVGIRRIFFLVFSWTKRRASGIRAASRDSFGTPPSLMTTFVHPGPG